jgi:hypothetical protein
VQRGGAERERQALALRPGKGGGEGGLGDGRGGEGGEGAWGEKREECDHGRGVVA